MRLTAKRRSDRDQVEGSRAIRGVLIGLALSVVLWALIIALVIWLI